MDTEILKRMGDGEDGYGQAKRRRWLTAGAAIGVTGSLALTGYAILRPLRLLNHAAKLRLAAAGIFSRYITVDGYQIHYYEGGPVATPDKPPIVLVHGLGGYAEHWTDLMVQLVAAQRRVYALDLLGYGKSDKPEDASYSVPEEAGIVEGFLRAKGIGDYDLGGWSMGGWVALLVALNQNHPDENHSFRGRLRRLMLFNSAGLRYELDWDTNVFVPDTPEKLHGLNQLLLPHSASLPGFVARAVMREAQRDGWVIQRSMESMLAGLDVVDGKLGQLDMPVLIAWGSEDRIVPLSVGERMHAEIPQSVLEVYEGYGHLAPVNGAGKIGPRVIEFLDAMPPEVAGICGG